MNHLAETTRMAAEQRFGYKVRQLLNETESTVSSERLQQLAQARKAALQVQKTLPPSSPALEWNWALSTQGNGSKASFSFGNFLTPEYGRMGLLVGAVILVGACVVGLFQVEQQKRIENLADIDSEVLTDDLPVSAYADHGFNAFLKQNE